LPDAPPAARAAVLRRLGTAVYEDGRWRVDYLPHVAPFVRTRNRP
jgi:hypothetical protein